MTDHGNEDDDVPILRDLVRHGRKRAARNAPGADTTGPELSAAEIEAIAARIVAEQTEEIEQAVARGIREALAARAAAPEEDADE